MPTIVKLPPPHTHHRRGCRVAMRKCHLTSSLCLPVPFDKDLDEFCEVMDNLPCFLVGELTPIQWAPQPLRFSDEMIRIVLHCSTYWIGSPAVVSAHTLGVMLRTLLSGYGALAATYSSCPCTLGIAYRTKTLRICQI